MDIKNKSDTLSSRLAHALDVLKISKAQLARKINVKRQAIQYLCTSGANRSKFAYDIAEALNISVDWLVTGQGEMVLRSSSEQQLLSEQNAIPILAWNQINQWLSGKIDCSNHANWTSAHQQLSTHAYALHLRDNAMFPRFESDTLIIIEPEMPSNPPCFVVAYIERIHDYVFRQLTKEKDEFVLHTYNDLGYKKLSLSKDDKILGKMVEAKWMSP